MGNKLSLIGNEETNRLVREGARMPLTGAEPFCGTGKYT